MNQWHEKTDVVVVGSGAAGLSAAIEARKAGVSTTVFEKMKLTGGNTRIADGGLSAACNFLQKSMGVKDSPDLLFEDMLKAGLRLNHPRLARIVADRGAEAVDWTKDVLGVRYMDRLDRFGGHSVARTVTTVSHSGVEIVNAQTARLKQLGVEIRTRCCLDELISDENGEVLGVKILSGYNFSGRNFEDVRYVRAGKAVVLAAGGFGSDKLFCALQNPALDDSILSTNHRGATAGAMGAAFKKGAAPVQLSCIQLGPWGCADEKGYGRGGRFASYAAFPRGIVVEPATGMRIVNEWSDRKTRSDAMLKTGGPCLGIVDSEGAKSDPESLAICLRSGKIKEFETLAELARAYGAPPDVLEKTAKYYNKMVEEKQIDEFGKPLGNSALPLEKPPYYGIKLQPKVHYTPGGVGIDEKARVVDIKGEPVPGLFAAGEICGGIHGADRLGGCALVECIVFGRIAGREAAALRNKPERSRKGPEKS